ncbi:MAG: PAS domain S-box protein [Opitutae bacterium]|nr:PAS domain S-box protein [Opitutae bacterium]
MPVSTPITAIRTILIVEDEEEDRENFRIYIDMFSDSEIRFLEEETGRAGLETFSANAVDCILLGLNLPDMSGLEFLSRFKQKFGDYICPIVMLTGKGSEEDAVMAMNQGAHDYLSKLRLNPELLQRAIENAAEKVSLQKRLEHQRLDLEVKNHQLRVMKDHLEKLVEERTRDLLLTNERLLVEIEERRKAERKVRENAKFSRMIVDAVPPFMAYVDHRNCYRFANRQYERVFNCKESEILERPISDHLGHAFQEARRKVMQGEHQEFEHAQANTNGLYQTYKIALTPHKKKGGEVVGYFIVGSDVTERLITEQSLLESDAKFSALFRDAATGIALSDLEGSIIDCNAAFQRILGCLKPEILGHGIQKFYAEPMGEDEREFLRECKHGKRWSYRIDKPLKAKDGHTIWGRLNTSMILGINQAPQFVVHMLEDITPQKENEAFIQKSLDEKQVLLREVHHRVKNNLQVIQSLLRMQARDVKGSALEPLLRESQNRIRSIALIHEQLYKQDDFAEIDFADYLSQLLRQLFHTFDLKHLDVTSSIDFEDIYLSLTKAIPCALIANELVTNSLKYAFHGRSEGKISINASQNKGWLTMIIKDDGAGFPEDLDIEASKTLGLKVVRTLTRQLGGEMEIISDGGAEFRLSFMP